MHVATFILRVTNRLAHIGYIFFLDLYVATNYLHCFSKFKVHPCMLLLPRSIEWTFLNVIYRISQNFRNLKISQIIAKISCYPHCYSLLIVSCPCLCIAIYIYLMEFQKNGCQKCLQIKILWRRLYKVDIKAFLV